MVEPHPLRQVLIERTGQAIDRRLALCNALRTGGEPGDVLDTLRDAEPLAEGQYHRAIALVQETDVPGDGDDVLTGAGHRGTGES